MRIFQRQLATWRLLIPRYQLSQRLSPYTEPIDVQLNEGLRQITALVQLAERCRVAARPFDARSMSAALEAVTRTRESVRDFTRQDVASVSWLAGEARSAEARSARSFTASPYR
jgi:hypothetical protein